MQEKTYKIFENLFSKDILTSNLTFAAFYIAFYEAIKDNIVGNIKGLYCIDTVRFEDGKIKSDATDRYKNEILNRKPDGRNKDAFLSSLIWLKDGNAITDEEYDFIANTARQIRNDYAHRLFNILTEKITDIDFQNLKRLLEINRKINKWWTVEIEGFPEDSENMFDTVTEIIYSTLFNENLGAVNS